MDKIKKEVVALIDQIKAYSDRLESDKHIPQQELELILSKIKNLYEKTIVLSYLSSASEETTGTASVAEKLNTAKPIGSMDLFGSALPPAAEKTKPEKKADLPAGKAVKKEEQAPVHPIQKPPIIDLKLAIGINDQFQFANELFEGSIQEYSIAIQQLNAAGTLESAIDYFSNLQQLYNWDEKNETARRLLDLIDRRYNA